MFWFLCSFRFSILSYKSAVCVERVLFNAGTMHVFHALTYAVARGSCLIPKALGRGFKLLPRNTANVNALKCDSV